MPNTDLFVEVLAVVALEPSRWNQLIWAGAPVNGKPTKHSCNSSHCIAGWAVVRSGRALSWYQHFGGTWGASSVFGAGSIEEEAESLLGIDDYQARQLFAGENTLEEVYEAAMAIFGLTLAELKDLVAAKVVRLRAEYAAELDGLKLKLRVDPPSKPEKLERLQTRAAHLKALLDREPVLDFAESS